MKEKLSTKLLVENGIKNKNKSRKTKSREQNQKAFCHLRREQGRGGTNSLTHFALSVVTMGRVGGISASVAMTTTDDL